MKSKVQSYGQMNGSKMTLGPGCSALALPLCYPPIFAFFPTGKPCYRSTEMAAVNETKQPPPIPSGAMTWCYDNKSSSLMLWKWRGRGGGEDANLGLPRSTTGFFVFLPTSACCFCWESCSATIAVFNFVRRREGGSGLVTSGCKMQDLLKHIGVLPQSISTLSIAL